MSLLDAAGVVTGDIWCSGAFSFESPLKDLLDSGEYTLEQLLAEDELLQELRGVHPELIEFFSTEQAVAGLIEYITLSPDGPPPSSSGLSSSPPDLSGSMETAPLDDENDAANENEAMETVTTTDEAINSAEISQDSGEEEAKDKNEITATRGPEDEDPERADELEQLEQEDAVYIRYPYMSCEVICCEVQGIIDTLVDGYIPHNMSIGEEAESEKKNDSRRSILDFLFSMLYEAEAGEIDDYRAGYFDKILSVLFRKRPQALGEYINEGGGRGNEALMKVMFKHLYSHSIMQIVQRLLLPQPPLPPKEEGEDEKEGDDLYADPLDGVDMDGFGSFRCNWSESRAALEMLLECLIEPSRYPEIEEDEELRLSLHQNASEVLITIIQNSPLTSPTLHVLTTNPVLEKLIQASTVVEEDDEFSPHDSRLTCAMNVMESLILQLGGYGSVGTMMYPEDEDDDVCNDEGDNEKTNEESSKTRQELATSETLISHLPMMLSNLADLLTYPDAEKWASPMQFSPGEPQRILGSSRLRIVRLLESLVLLGDPNVDSQLCNSNCLEICLDLFWKFQWCSMLHQSVANLLVHVFEGANSRAELQSYFLVKCNLLGRLMDSFWEAGESTSDFNHQFDPSVPSSVEAEKGSSGGDDVTAVPEEDILDDPQQLSTDDDGSDSKGPVQPDTIGQSGSDQAPPQSFRLGYMGHVIIICQALVHACSNDIGDPSLGGTTSEMNGELGEFVARNNEESEEMPGEPVDSISEGLEKVRAAESVFTEETPVNPLILAQLVENHPLQKQWDEFIQSTLASETAIQSTPLGGFPGSPGIDPLHAHRPGLAEDYDDDDDDGAAPPLPPRGLLVGGDVIDMDDNDLDVAASMMAGLSMGRAGEGNQNDQDLLSGIPQQTDDSNPPGGYMFDDPLGDGRFGRFGPDEDEDSSDEESEMSGNTGDSGGVVIDGISSAGENTDEAPVMDLFAGNFDAFGEDSAAQQTGNWSDFANFDNAFEDQDTRVDNQTDLFQSGPSNGEIDEIFGESKDHASLLEEMDDPVDDNAEAQTQPTEENSSIEEVSKP